ncbi:uncharacterized protein LOC110825415 [Carica papaya]|uniref:uncharacterized protein LOC110825415 n=1 Tax=Carica papaya TaxID=3649 RepID=UPI000B8CF908|nr:uncharacterized protein LOC110825415 [Carica papaya]
MIVVTNLSHCVYLYYSMFLLDMLSNMHPIPPATCNKHTCAGNRAEMNIAESNDKFDLEKLVMTAPGDRAFSIGSLSSLPKVKRSSTASQLRDFLPANHSSLTSSGGNHTLKWSHSTDTRSDEKKILISGRKNFQYENCETVDLNCDILLNKKSSKEEVLVPFSVKRRKVLELEHENEQHASVAGKSQSSEPSISRSVKHENPQMFYGSNLENGHVSSQFLSNADGKVRARGADFFSLENKDVHVIAGSCDDSETRGSAFLIQVMFFHSFSFIIWEYIIPWITVHFHHT